MEQIWFSTKETDTCSTIRSYAALEICTASRYDAIVVRCQLLINFLPRQLQVQFESRDHAAIRCRSVLIDIDIHREFDRADPTEKMTDHPVNYRG